MLQGNKRMLFYCMRVFICMVFSTRAGICQKSDAALLLVKYKLLHVYDTTKPDVPGEEIMQLRVSKAVSEFSSYEFETEYYKMDKARYAVKQPDGTMLYGSNYPANYIKKSRIIQYNYFTGAKSYWVYNGIYRYFVGYEFAIPEIRWTITDEKKTIGDILCQKATAWVKGRLYDAWFAPSLPFSTGPWKLHGLPGLILEAYDQKRQVQFSFVSLENIADLNLIIQLPVKTIKTNKEKFDALMETIKQNPFAMSMVIGGSSDDAERFLKDNAELIAKQKLENVRKQNITVNNPVELQQ